MGIRLAGVVYGSEGRKRMSAGFEGSDRTQAIPTLSREERKRRQGLRPLERLIAVHDEVPYSVGPSQSGRLLGSVPVPDSVGRELRDRLARNREQRRELRAKKRSEETDEDRLVEAIRLDEQRAKQGMPNLLDLAMIMPPGYEKEERW